MSIPRLISVDDHLVEPPNLWQLPGQVPRGIGPRVERQYLENGRQMFSPNPTGEGSNGKDVDVWRYEDLAWPITRPYAYSGYPDSNEFEGITFDEMMPAAFQQGPRLKVLDENHTEAR